MGEEAVALAFQFGAQFRIIVDAAVEGDGQAQFGIDHGLGGAFGQVDDLQPAMAETKPSLLDNPASVGPARRKGFSYSRDGFRIGESFIETNFPGYSTHVGMRSPVLFLLAEKYFSDSGLFLVSKRLLQRKLIGQGSPKGKPCRS